MIINFIRNTLGTRNQRLIRQMYKTVERINALEQKTQALSDVELQAKTPEFKTRLAQGELLDDLLPEVFAVVREVSIRTLGLRHFDVQLVGGIALHAGKIAEMRTGEGKTLVATLPAYLNALSGQGVHIVTVNDYLAKRDAEWMSPIFQFLGMTIGVNLAELSPALKKEAYQADITYGTNNEFGFDYLRDNMAFTLEARVQRKLHYAIIDEVDSILIDESRTPLIISGMAEQSSDMYIAINQLIPLLKKHISEEEPGDFVLEEKTRQAYLTERGHIVIEKLLSEAGLLKEGTSLYDVNNIVLMHHVNAGLRAHKLYHRDIDYIVQDNKVVIVDEHTGRLMGDRRWSEGLHQATEAKEGVPIKSENQTLASITFQNYFRLYEKLSGMTGTADTEAYEFQHIYGLEVVVVPTNQPVIRKDLPDQVYLTQKAKFAAIVKNIQERKARGQPVLVGTASIETSEYLSALLSEAGIVHQVLNAKFHEREARIISEAGRPGTVTIATNMAGRGTDIVLGGNLKAELGQFGKPLSEEVRAHEIQWQEAHDQVIAAGGLHVLGTERSESRRIDNQLRGRSGRQGDPGSSQYYLSLEDHLMRIFAPERMSNVMRRLGMKEDEVIENIIITRSIESAQRKVEGHNFDIRKQLLEFDDVANDQRKVIYQQRKELMVAGNMSETIEDIYQDVLHGILDEFIPLESLEEQWDISGLEQHIQQEFGVYLPLAAWLEEEVILSAEDFRMRIIEGVLGAYRQKKEKVGEEVMCSIEKTTLLQSLDWHWRDHLAAMDHLRKGIHLRGYAQKNPKQEYKREAFLMFTDLLNQIKRDVVSTLSTLEVNQPGDVDTLEAQRLQESAVKNLQFIHPDSTASALIQFSEEVSEENAFSGSSAPSPVSQKKIGRNAPCPCGSGKKFKQCHGVLQ